MHPSPIACPGHNVPSFPCPGAGRSRWMVRSLMACLFVWGWHGAALGAALAEDMIDGVLPARCVAHVMTVPLMSHSGSPVVPVEVNGVSGLAYVSFTQEEVGVFLGTMDYPKGQTFPIQTIGGRSYSFSTVVRSFHLAQGVAENVPACVVGDTIEKIGDRPVLAIVGYSILSNYDVLLDFVGKKMVLFRLSETAQGCRAMSQWLGPDAVSLPLQANERGVRTGIEVTAGNVPLHMEVEPGSNASVVRQKDARAAGITHAVLRDDPRVRTVVGRVLLGHRHHFDNVTIGEWKGQSLDVNVEKAQYNLLGMDFLRNRKVLMAFPQGMLYVTRAQASTDGDLRVRSALSTHLATATVQETGGVSR
ncbi:retroviral-like aspartic protease family protein [Komagataeibacter pomaceti]|nr:retroviral-like aspartic protease family protein [Novacetimonas pomaceti]